jgi:hypothetical protein
VFLELCLPPLWSHAFYLGRKILHITTPSNTPICHADPFCTAPRSCTPPQGAWHKRCIAEVDLSNAERQVADMNETITAFEAQIHEMKEQIGRREQRAVLAEWEIGFLQALVVRFTSLNQLFRRSNPKVACRQVSWLKRLVSGIAARPSKDKLRRPNHGDYKNSSLFWVNLRQRMTRW